LIACCFHPNSGTGEEISWLFQLLFFPVLSLFLYFPVGITASKCSMMMEDEILIYDVQQSLSFSVPVNLFQVMSMLQNIELQEAVCLQ